MAGVQRTIPARAVPGRTAGTPGLSPRPRPAPARPPGTAAGRTGRRGTGPVVFAYMASAIAALLYLTPLVGLGAYVAAFALLAVRWPAVALAVAISVTPFQNDVGGLSVKFSLAELSLAIALPVVIYRTRGRLLYGPTLPFTAAYLIVCVICSVGSVRGASVVSIVQMVLYLVVAVVVFANLVPDVAKLVRGCDAYVGLTTLFSIANLAVGFSAFGLNKNGVGASVASALVVAIELWVVAAEPKRRRWLAVAVVVMSGTLVLTVSRGSWMAAATGLAVICIMRRQFSLLLRVGVLLVPVLVAAWLYLPQNLQDYATGFDSGRANIQSRYASIDFALEQFEQNPLVGVGVGLRKEYDATNIVLGTLAETGVLGLAALTLVHVAVWRMGARTSRQVAWTDPAYSALVLAVALTLGRFAHGLVDHYWSRGPVTVAWAAVGMATLVHAQAGRFRMPRHARRPPAAARA